MLFRRALANLMSNAIRHARSGSVIELIARTHRGVDGRSAVLEVVNEGEPVPPAVLSRLFDRFYRADDARHGEAGGSGLGLAIVRAILMLHGGSAEVCQPSAGRIAFVLTLPYGPAPSSSDRER